ncbi:hypothetical protein OO012_05820 [Rhodobacteraceae bacterium KMM 6894]|nr:hypothetical protein [Rhodobacteraceae bacterium KMM 6894]
MTDTTGHTPGHSQPGQSNDLKDKAKAAAQTASQQIKAGAQGAADTVATEAAGYANQAKDAAADEVKGVASALRTAADEMRRGSPQERTFSQIADGLADASDAMHDKDLGQMVGAVSDFAKRNPLVFLGSAALLGFAATRFAKASGRDANSAEYQRRAERMDRPPPAERPDIASAGSTPGASIASAQERNTV